MTARHVSHAAKFASDIPFKYARNTNYTSDTDAATRSCEYPTDNNYIRITNTEPHEQEGVALRSCDTTLSTTPGSSTVKSLQHQGQCLSMTDTIFSPHPSVPPVKSVLPVHCGDPFTFVDGMQGSVDDSPQSARVAALVSAFHNFSPQLLRTLDANLCRDLLSLFGTLSDDGGAHRYRSQYDTRNLSASREEGYWDEVVLVARRMENEGYAFGDKENYWSMRAYLECWKTLGSTGAFNTMSYHSLS